MGQRSLQDNYYEILEVEQDAAQHEIHEAFQRARKTYSVDSAALYSMFSQEEAQQLLKLVEEAFAVLGNQTLRQAYDQKLQLHQNWEAPTTDAEQMAAIEPQPAPSEDWSTPQPQEAPQGEPVGTWGKGTAELKVATEIENVGRTKLSTYEIDEAFEEEIVAQQVIDGSFLKRVREYKNVTIVQVCDSTRIGKNYVEAIEANDYSSLPAPVFVRGFVIQICRILNMDEKKVAGSYLKLMKESLR